MKKWLWPVENGKLTSKYSPSRKHPVTGEIKPHYGIDISGNNLPVRLVAPGEIVGMYKLENTPRNEIGRRMYGNYIVQKITKGFDTVNVDPKGKGLIIEQIHFYALYAHLGSFSNDIVRGMYYDKGKTIGLVGATGDRGDPIYPVCSGPHLHLETHLFVINNRVNPIHFFKESDYAIS